MKLKSYIGGEWVAGTGKSETLVNAVNGAPVAELMSGGFESKSALEYGRRVGGPAMRALTFHERARAMKRLAQYLVTRKEELYEISYFTGATKGDSWIDIEGGIGTLFTYASKGRREFPDEVIYIDGPTEQTSKLGTFQGTHICVPLEGVAVHINAFNFPCWGMLEKLSASLLAGMPAIVKPASITSFLAARMFEMIIESEILPEGALQLVCGSVHDLFDHLTCQDVVTFTGSASTGRKLKSHPNILENSVRFNMEADSLNCSILGPDATPGTDEFDLYVKEIVREMTVKAGQKCTAIRRIIAPRAVIDDLNASIQSKLAQNRLGDPKADGVRMGPLVGLTQRNEVRERVQELVKESQIVHGSLDDFEVVAGDRQKGAFFPAMLLYCNEPLKSNAAHSVEAFGPVSTVMPYDSIDEAIELARLGKGSLVGSLFTIDPRVARSVTLGVAPYHGRVVILNRLSAKESTGHGSPLPHLVHGGPGRAGGGEELGGMRGVMHYMQRTAIQGHPDSLTAVTNEWIRGATQTADRIHPFKKSFEELVIGETLRTHNRTVTEADIVRFAGISGDFFYAHMDELSAQKSLFERRVAHGYFVLSAAAGLFVDPAPGPVLANYGLEKLRFVKPVYPGDSISVRLTCMRKTRKEDREGSVPQGVVEWDVEVFNQSEETVASYSILTLVACAGDPICKE